MSKNLTLIYLFLTFLPFPLWGLEVKDCTVASTAQWALSDFSNEPKGDDAVVIDFGHFQDLSAAPSDAELALALKKFEFVVFKKRFRPVLAFTFVDPFQSEDWEPVLVPLNNRRDLNQYSSCQALENLKSWYKKKRIAARNSFKFYARERLSTEARARLQEQSVGQTILSMEEIFLWEKHQEPVNGDYIASRYMNILTQVKEIRSQISHPDQFFSAWPLVMAVIYENKLEDINYCRDKALMTSALQDGCTNCVGETLLFLALFRDGQFELPEGWELKYESFRDHVRAVAFNRTLEKSFDLAYGRFEDSRGAIYAVNELHYALLRGSDGLHHSKELAELPFRTRLSKPEWKPTSCILPISPRLEPATQMASFGWSVACGRFSPGRPPKGEIDTQSRLESTSFSSTDTVGGNSSNDVINIDSANREGYGFRQILGGLKNKLSGLGRKIEDALGLHRLSRLEHGNPQEYMENLSLLAEVDQDFLKQAEDSEQFIQTMADRFSKVDLLNRVGLVDGRSQGLVELHQTFDNESSCRVLKPIFIQFESERNLDGQAAHVRDYHFNSETNRLVVMLSDQELVNEAKNLSMPDRYALLLSYLEEEIDRNIHLIDLAFSENFKTSLDTQRKSRYQLIFLFSAIETYQNLILPNLNASSCKKWDSRKATPFGKELKHSYLARHRSVLEKIPKYVNAISERPHDFLDAITQSFTALPSVDSYEYFSDFSEVIDQSHSGPLFSGQSQTGPVLTDQGQSWALNSERFYEKYQFSALASELPSGFFPTWQHVDKFMSKIHLVIDSHRITPASFYKDFLDWLLFHPNFFFLPPLTESEEQVFGGVRPVVPLFFSEMKNSLIGQEFLAPELPSVNLPDINVTPCGPNDSGYVNRGTLVIYCSPGEGGTHRISTDERIRENSFDEFGDDSYSRDGYDEHQDEDLSNQNSTDQPQLPPSIRADEDLLEGVPFGQQRQNSQQIHDPRQPVIIEVGRWLPILEMLPSSLKQEPETSIALHHLQRESLEIAINTFATTDIGPFRIFPGYIFFEEGEVADLSQAVEQGQMSIETATDRAFDKLAKKSQQRLESGAPETFRDGSFRQFALERFVADPKPNWESPPEVSEQKRLLGSGYSSHNGVLLSSRTEHCQFSVISGHLLKCVPGYEMSEIRQILNLHFIKQKAY